MSAIALATKLPRTSYGQLYVKHIPTLGIWAFSLGSFFAWPYAFGKVSDKLHGVPSE